MTRRDVLALAAAAAAPRPRFRYAVCNETFGNMAFAEQCRLARKTGYTGLEIMPSTLGAAPPVAELRRRMRDEGPAFVGLHNLLTGPAGLHATTSDPAVYARTWEFVRSLVGLCGELGGGVMVFGSGKQRNAEPGMKPADAVARLTAGLAGVADEARRSGVTLLMEPLAPHLSNIVHTLAEAVAVVRQVGSPAVQTIFDVHNTPAEKETPAELLRRYRAEIRHVHLNEMDGKRPGLGDYDFAGLLRALSEVEYRGWLSLEVFDFAPSGEEVAARAREFLAKCEPGQRAARGSR